MWKKESQMADYSPSQFIICEIAGNLNADLIKDNPSMSKMVKHYMPLKGECSHIHFTWILKRELVSTEKQGMVNQPVLTKEL